MSSPFATPAMAEGYAKARPPLHQRIIDRAAALVDLKPPLEAALDLGCGSGLSVRPLLRLARRVVAFDPAHAMALIAASLAQPARTVTARAEFLPFRSGSFDLITAAGSLNYTDPAAALAEASRVLSPRGLIVVYDFSQGRSASSTPELAAWFDEFLSRYPMPAGEALHLDASSIAALAHGFEVVAAEEFEMPARMDALAYSAYLMTETNVAAAIRRGAGGSAIRRWLGESLAPIFRSAALDIFFPGYVICLRAA